MTHGLHSLLKIPKFSIPEPIQTQGFGQGRQKCNGAGLWAGGRGQARRSWSGTKAGLCTMAIITSLYRFWPPAAQTLLLLLPCAFHVPLAVMLLKAKDPASVLFSFSVQFPVPCLDRVHLHLLLHFGHVPQLCQFPSQDSCCQPASAEARSVRTPHTSVHFFLSRNDELSRGKSSLGDLKVDRGTLWKKK